MLWNSDRARLSGGTNRLHLQGQNKAKQETSRSRRQAKNIPGPKQDEVSSLGYYITRNLVACTGLQLRRPIVRLHKVGCMTRMWDTNNDTEFWCGKILRNVHCWDQEGGIQWHLGCENRRRVELPQDRVRCWDLLLPGLELRILVFQCLLLVTRKNQIIPSYACEIFLSVEGNWGVYIGMENTKLFSCNVSWFTSHAEALDLIDNVHSP
jgi:hypothetical protein